MFVVSPGPDLYIMRRRGQCRPLPIKPLNPANIQSLHDHQHTFLAQNNQFPTETYYGFISQIREPGTVCYHHPGAWPGLMWCHLRGPSLAVTQIQSFVRQNWPTHSGHSHHLITADSPAVTSISLPRTDLDTFCLINDCYPPTPAFLVIRLISAIKSFQTFSPDIPIMNSFHH